MQMIWCAAQGDFQHAQPPSRSPPHPHQPSGEMHFCLRLRSPSPRLSLQKLILLVVFTLVFYFSPALDGRWCQGQKSTRRRRLIICVELLKSLFLPDAFKSPLERKPRFSFLSGRATAQNKYFEGSVSLNDPSLPPFPPHLPLTM